MPMTATDEFNLMCDFLAFMSPKIEARDATPLNDEERSTLERIARGESNDSERDEVLDLLVGNSTALEFLATQLNANA